MQKALAFQIPIEKVERGGHPKITRLGRPLAAVSQNGIHLHTIDILTETYSYCGLLVAQYAMWIFFFFLSIKLPSANLWPACFQLGGWNKPTGLSSKEFYPGFWLGN